MTPTHTPVMDLAQLKRIESVHRGFLYQHLYGAGCLLLAARTGASSVVMEADEDVEIAYPGRRLYVQVKTRSEPLTGRDIEGAIQRFELLRREHEKGTRNGTAAFAVVANVRPGRELSERMKSTEWPTDTAFYWPGGELQNDALPPAAADLGEALTSCAALAANVPFGVLTPETLVWKLAGLVMFAASGTSPRVDHAFRVEELPQLFEQLVLELHDIPAPPPHYRPQEGEPDLISNAPVRVITGFSGAGKTMWVAQAAQHISAPLAYFDVGDTPGPAITIPLARELAARFFGKSGGLGNLLLPGASGTEMLRAIGLRLHAEQINALIVIDNAHRVPAENLRSVVQQIPHARFVFLAQPAVAIQELQALLAVAPERLGGWATDTIAAEASEIGCRSDYVVCERLRGLTGGLPLFVQNALQISKKEYDGEVARFCSELEDRTHDASTVQEIILSRVFQILTPSSRDAVAILCLADIPLERSETEELLSRSIRLDARAFARMMRELRLAGVIEVFGGDRLKTHDAMRVLGRLHLDTLGLEVARTARSALAKILIASIVRQRDLAKLSLYVKVLADLGDLELLVNFATDEIFHELGLIDPIYENLETGVTVGSISPKQRFTALEGLMLTDLKRGDIRKASEHLQAMDRLIGEHDLGEGDRLRFEMKAMNLAAMQGDALRVRSAIASISDLLPDDPEHHRIFKYNSAHAFFKLRQYEKCISITEELIPEYYDVLGLDIDDVMGKNPDDILPRLKEATDPTDDLKHLADCLDLKAHALNGSGQHGRFCRIHAMKFYSMANALDSYVRVGQDLVDEFVDRNDYIGAREVLERNVLPTVIAQKMVSHMVAVRGQYAVVLAYCGDHASAAAEIARLAPYLSGLSFEGQRELENQRTLVARLKQEAPPPQWQFPASQKKLGRNERCHCGSGKKFKHCHGARP